MKGETRGGAAEVPADGGAGKKRVLWLHTQPEHYHNCMLDDLARAARVGESGMKDVEFVAAFSHKGKGRYENLPLPVEIPSVILRPRPGKGANGPRYFERYHEDWRKDLQGLDFAAAIVGGYATRTHREVIRECWRRGIPVALWSDSNLRTQRGRRWRDRCKRQLKKRWLRHMIAKVDVLLTANSRGVAYWRYYGAPRNKIVICPAYADYAQAEAGRRSRRETVLAQVGLRADHRYVYSAANLLEIKGVDLMMQAFVEGGFGAKGWHFLLAGAGPLEAKLKALAGSQLGKSVRLLGFQQPRNNLALMAHADLFVLSSRYEAHGIVIGEALATGTPVLASRVCGAGADLIREGVSGGTFRTGDVGDLRAKLETLLSDPARLAALRQTSREMFERWFARTNPIQVVPAVLQRMLAGKKAAGETR